jgi:hypothetical protein
VSPRRWPQVLAVAVALRHSWRRDGLTRIAKRLRVSLAPPAAPPTRPVRRRSRPSRTPLSGSPQGHQGSPLRSDPARRGSRP